MAYLEERIEQLENNERRLQQQVAKIELLINKAVDDNQPMLTQMEAYSFLTGKNNATHSAASQFMGKPVKQGNIHKILVASHPMYERAELIKYRESRKVTGRLI